MHALLSCIGLLHVNLENTHITCHIIICNSIARHVMSDHYILGDGMFPYIALCYVTHHNMICYDMISVRII